MKALFDALRWLVAYLPARLLRFGLARRRSRRVVLHYRISGRLTEDPGSSSGLQPGARPGLNLLSLLSDLRAAARDPSVEAVALRLGGIEGSWAQIQELRAALLELRSKGRRTFAYLERPGHLEYALACACDHLSMAPVSELLLLGLRAEITFFKGGMDKLGVEAQIEAAGEFKSAGEPYLRESMSESSRESLDFVLKELHRGLCLAIEEGRAAVAPGGAQSVLDAGPFASTEAKERGLVDELIYPDRWKRVMRRDLGEPQPESLDPDDQDDGLDITPRFGEPKVDADPEATRPFRPMARPSPLRFVSGRKFLRPWRWLRSLEGWGLGSPRVVVLVLSGPIVGSEAIQAPAGRIAWRPTVSLLRSLAKDDRCEAVVLRVDSPGGDSFASDLIWREVRALAAKKPVVASMGGFAASGGYYLSMAADWIVAGPQTITGSIGVLAGRLDLSGLLDRLGLKREVLSYGAHTGLPSVSVGLTDGERERLRSLVDQTYDDFVGRAAACRGVEESAIEEQARGRIWTGMQAKERGLVDATGGLQEALVEAAKRARLGRRWEPWFCVPSRPSLAFRVLSALQVASPALFSLAAEWGGLEDPRTTESWRIFARLPFDLKIR